MRGEGEGYLIFIIIAAIVRAEADEYRQFAILRIGAEVGQGFGMGKHLQASVLAHIHACILVDGTGIAGSQLFQFQAHARSAGGVAAVRGR